MIKYRLGKFFPPSAIFGGYVLMAAGIFVLAVYVSPLGLLLVIMGMLVSFLSRGCAIDPTKGRFRLYLNFSGIKFGRWKNLSPFRKICLKQKRQAYAAYSWSNRSKIFARTIYILLIRDETNRKEEVIALFEKKEEGEKAMDDLAQLLNLEKN
jgi:hypothetical protein